MYLYLISTCFRTRHGSDIASSKYGSQIVNPSHDWELRILYASQQLNCKQNFFIASDKGTCSIFELNSIMLFFNFDHQDTKIQKQQDTRTPVHLNLRVWNCLYSFCWWDLQYYHCCFSIWFQGVYSNFKSKNFGIDLVLNYTWQLMRWSEVFTTFLFSSIEIELAIFSSKHFHVSENRFAPTLAQFFNGHIMCNIWLPLIWYVSRCSLPFL